MRSEHRIAAVSATFFVALAGCERDTPPPPTPPPVPATAVHVAHSAPEVPVAAGPDASNPCQRLLLACAGTAKAKVGATVPLAAFCDDQFRHWVRVRDVSYRVDPPALGTIGADGQLQVRGAGRITVRAERRGVDPTSCVVEGDPTLPVARLPYFSVPPEYGVFSGEAALAADGLLTLRVDLGSYVLDVEARRGTGADAAFFMVGGTGTRGAFRPVAPIPTTDVTGRIRVETPAAGRGLRGHAELTTQGGPLVVDFELPDHSMGAREEPGAARADAGPSPAAPTRR